jgi:hypothetical protein
MDTKCYTLILLEEFYLLGYDDVWSVRSQPTFRRNNSLHFYSRKQETNIIQLAITVLLVKYFMLFSTTTVKMEAIYST